MLKKQLNRELVASFRTVKTFFQFGTNADSSPYAKCSTDACYFCVHRAKAWRAREPFAKDFFTVQRELFELRVDNIMSTVSCHTPVLCAPKRTQLQTTTQIQTSFKSNHSSLCIHYSNSTSLPCMTTGTMMYVQCACLR
jgi:hypothetical protein